MTTAFAPRTCKQCGRHYSVKPGNTKYTGHRMGVCDVCRPRKTENPFARHSDYSHIKPIADEDDDTRPTWRMHTDRGVWILLTGDVANMTKRLSDYWAKRLGMRMDVFLDLDDDLQPTGEGIVVGPETGKTYRRFKIERIRAEVVAA